MQETMYNALQGALVVAQTALAMAPKQEAPAQEPIAHLKFWAAQSWGGSGNHDIEYAEGLCVCEKGEIGDDKLPAFPVYAAPAAANGALTDEQIQDITTAAVKRGDVSWLGYREDAGGKYTIPQLSPYHFQFARAILSAAGPDAALIDERQAFEAAFRKDEGIPSDIPSSSLCCDREWMGWQWRAALSGDKGN